MGKILCCIPARYNSSRLPGKPLLKFNNKTIINLVYEKAKQTKVDKIIILTDDYYHWDGQRRATDDFFKSRNINYNFVNIGNFKTAAIIKT